MLKAELYDALIAAGYTDEELDDKLKSELQVMYDDLPEEPPVSEIKEIISKRKTEYWLSDGSKIPFKEFDKPVGYLKPFPKAGDKIKRVGDKWVLA
jgi:hypothetical protein